MEKASNKKGTTNIFEEGTGKKAEKQKRRMGDGKHEDDEKLDAMRQLKELNEKMQKNTNKLNPSKHSKKIKYFKRMNDGVRRNFKQAQYIEAEPRSLRLDRKRNSNNEGAARGREVHKVLKDFIAGKGTSMTIESATKEFGDKMEVEVKSFFREFANEKSLNCKEFELLQNGFKLRGYMSTDDVSFMWSGIPDAIGWFNGRFVIVEWKVIDLLYFWEKNTVAYGDYLHQALVYAKLLMLHLDLTELPYILIVPISNLTCTDIKPGLFYDLPLECKRKLDKFKWSKCMPVSGDSKTDEPDSSSDSKTDEPDSSSSSISNPNPTPNPTSLRLKSATLSKGVINRNFKDIRKGIVNKDAKVGDLLKEGCTVRELIEELGFSEMKILK